MKFSARGHYGLIAMTYLAQCKEEDTPISIKTIAQEEQIPEEFLKQIFHTLRQAGLVESVRGARGGVCLAKDADQLTAGEIMRALDGQFAPIPCLKKNELPSGCQKMGSCATKTVWRTLREIMDDYLDSITLKDIIK